MDHVAIMSKKLGLTPWILSGEKTIESRWYKARFAPWDKIHSGDTIYFKNSGEKITIKAEVEKVLQFEDLDLIKARWIVDRYGKAICLQNKDVEKWARGKRYCILIFLKNPQMVDKPFAIDKSGFGTGAAWICVEDISSIKINYENQQSSKEVLSRDS
jgi:predicted transcriptional regulator